MDLLNLLTRLADLAPPTAPHPAAPRRAALGQLRQAGTALLPALLLTALAPSAAPAGTLDDTRTRLDVLLLLRQLALLGSELHGRALGLVAGFAALPLTAAEKTGIQVIRQQETQRTALLSGLIADGGAALPASPNYDFTGSQNGARPALYPDIRTNPDTYLLVAQLLKDATVQAYKGQAPYVRTDGYLTEIVLRAHTTEARHAAHLRTLRRQRGATVKSWISPDDVPITTPGTAASRVYAGESNRIQSYFNISNGAEGPPISLPFDSTLPINVATPPLSAEGILGKVAEAFDEPAEAVVATNLAALFIY